MAEESKEIYAVPAKFRSIENMHVLFWLVKDICWATAFKPLGIAMIFPTLSIAVYIMVKNRKSVSELTHNLAIAFWIIANSMWMVLEFFSLDEQYKAYCLIPFSLGLAVLIYFYALYLPFRRKRAISEPVMVSSERPVAEL